MKWLAALVLLCLTLAGCAPQRDFSPAQWGELSRHVGNKLGASQ